MNTDHLSVLKARVLALQEKLGRVPSDRKPAVQLKIDGCLEKISRIEAAPKAESN